MSNRPTPSLAYLRLYSNFQAASAYDGMTLIATTLGRTRGNSEAGAFMAALKGYSAASPRGTVAIDDATHDIVQTIYIRRIDKLAGGQYGATEIDRYDNVRDPAKPN